jgi:hypothetical protein
MAYMLQLELNLKLATDRIRALEAELRSLRAESLVTDGCMLSHVLIDTDMMGIYPD